VSTTPAALASPIPRFLPLFAVALVVRIGTVALGSYLGSLPPDTHSDPHTPTLFRDELLSSSARVIEPWYHFDALWFANVARNGYANARDDGGRLGVAFLPALPATLAVGDALGLNMFWFGLIVCNLTAAAGAAVFARVAARQLTDSVSGWYALALLLTFPTAFFYSAPYTEAFGLLFTSIVLSTWQRNRPLIAGLAALGGSLVRLTGIAPGMAAVLDWLIAGDRRTRPRALVVSVALGNFAGLALFCGFLWWTVGDPFTGLKAQAMWGRRGPSLWNPLYTIESIYDPTVSRPEGATHFAPEAIAVFGFTLLGFRAWARRGAFWGLLVLVPITQMFVTGTLLSGHRLVLAGLPAFIELADLLRHRRALFFATLLAFGFAQLLLLNRYVHWQFAG
jgi:hypothetical protein